MRFTRSKDNKTLFAIVLAWPEDGIINIKSMANGAPTAEKIKNVSLIGYDGEINWKTNEKGLIVSLPKKPTSEHGFAIKIHI
ncbi:alpha-L-fucosidase C-terminal domain-containing protein [Zobellia nedashkovskayae]